MGPPLSGKKQETAEITLGRRGGLVGHLFLTHLAHVQATQLEDVKVQAQQFLRFLEAGGLHGVEIFDASVQVLAVHLLLNPGAQVQAAGPMQGLQVVTNGLGLDVPPVGDLLNPEARLEQLLYDTVTGRIGAGIHACLVVDLSHLGYPGYLSQDAQALSRAETFQAGHRLQGDVLIGHFVGNALQLIIVENLVGGFACLIGQLLA